MTLYRAHIRSISRYMFFYNGITVWPIIAVGDESRAKLYFMYSFGFRFMTISGYKYNIAKVIYHMDMSETGFVQDFVVITSIEHNFNHINN